MKAPDFREKFDELQRLIEAETVPVWVKAESIVLGKLTFKLFHRVYEACPTSFVGTANRLPGFHASNLLCELIEAYRAFDWPRVSILVHGASLPKEGQDSTGGPMMRLHSPLCASLIAIFLVWVGGGDECISAHIVGSPKSSAPLDTRLGIIQVHDFSKNLDRKNAVAQPKMMVFSQIEPRVIGVMNSLPCRYWLYSYSFSTKSIPCGSKDFPFQSEISKAIRVGMATVLPIFTMDICTRIGVPTVHRSNVNWRTINLGRWVALNSSLASLI